MICHRLNSMLCVISLAVFGCLTAGCTPPPAERGAATTGVEAAAGTTVPASITGTVGAAGAEDVTGAAGAAPDVELVAIDVVLPAPAFRGTPVPVKEPRVKKPRGHPRPPFLAPRGTVNLALAQPVETSDAQPTAGEVDFAVDGDKEASDFGLLELHPGPQWIQVDLAQPATIYAVVLWHNHADARVYRDVVVQVSDEPYFLNPTTIFNNDYDNTTGLGIGEDMGYVETAEGKLIDAAGVEGRYVRFYSNGSTIDGKNHYTEVEIYGIPLK